MKRLLKSLTLIMLALTAAAAVLACAGSNNDLSQPIDIIDGFLPVYDGQTTAPYGEMPDLDGVVIDGMLDDQLWQDKKWYSSYDTDARVGLFVTTAISQKGLYVAMKSSDKSVFWTYRNHFEVNTNVQLHIKTDAGQKTFSFDANNIAPTRYSVNARTCAIGKINLVGKASGLCAEMFISWEELGFSGVQESVMMLPLYNFKESETRSLKTLYPTFQKMLTGGYDDYYEFDKNGSVTGDDKDATIGNHEIGLGKTNVWEVTRDDEGNEIVTANGARRVFGQAIFFKGVSANHFRISAKIKANQINSSKTRAGLLIYNSNVSYRSVAVELSTDCYSEGNLHTVKLSGYTDYPKGTTVTTDFATVANTEGEGRAADEVELTLYYSSGDIYYIVNGQLVYSESITYLNNCYLGLYSFNSSAIFYNPECEIFDNAEQVREELSEFVYMVNVINQNEMLARAEMDKLCVPKTENNQVTATFTCAEGYTVDQLYLILEDESELDVKDQVVEGAENASYTFTGVDQSLTLYCSAKPIEEQTVCVKAGFYNKDEGEDEGTLGSVRLTLIGSGAFTRYQISGYSSDNAMQASVPSGYSWTFIAEASGFRPLEGVLGGGEQVDQSFTEAERFAMTQNVVGGVATSEDGKFIVSSTPGSVWDMSNERNDEVYFQTTNNKHTTIYFSGETVSEYHVAYVEITNQTDPLAFTSLERDPAVGFVFQTGRYEQEGKAMLRFAGMRLVPDGVWENKVDTGNIFSGYEGYDIATSKGVIRGEPYLSSGGTVNRLSYAGREDTTSFLMIRANQRVYFYVANGSKQVGEDGSGFEKLTYLYEYEDPAFGGNAAIGLGATVTYNLRLKFANYWLLSGEEAKAFASDKVTSTLSVEGEIDKVSVESAGSYQNQQNQTVVYSGSEIKVSANGLAKNQMLELTLNGQTRFVSASDSASYALEEKNKNYVLDVKVVDSITVEGYVEGYNASRHGALSGKIYYDGSQVGGFEVKNGAFRLALPKGKNVKIEIGGGKYLSERVSTVHLTSDCSLGEIEIAELPFGGSVKTDADTTLQTNCDYDYLYSPEEGATAHVREESTVRVLNTLALQSQPMTDAVVKFTYSRKSAESCGYKNGIDEGALGVGVTVTDGNTLRTMLFLRNGYRVYGDQNASVTVDRINEQLGPVSFSTLNVVGVDVMIVKHGERYYGLTKYSAMQEYELVWSWASSDEGLSQLTGKVNFGITFSAGKSRFVDFTVSNVSVEEYVPGSISALVASVECSSDDNGQIAIEEGYVSKEGDEYCVYKQRQVTVTVTPSQGNIISAIYVGDGKIAMEDYEGGAYSFLLAVEEDVTVRAEYVSAADVCYVRGSVEGYGANAASVTVRVYDQNQIISEIGVDGEGEYAALVPKGVSLQLEASAPLMLSKKISVGELTADVDAPVLTLEALPFGGSVTTVGGSRINTHEDYEYEMTEEGAQAHLTEDGITNLINTLALQSEAMQDAEIKFSYTRKSAAECSSSNKDEGAIGIGISVSDGSRLRTLLLVRKGYRVLANNNNGTTVDQINAVVNSVDTSPINSQRVDVIALKRGSDFYMLCKSAADTQYTTVFSWKALENGVTELGGKCNFAITFMASRGNFVDITVSNVSVKPLDTQDYPQIF